MPLPADSTKSPPAIRRSPDSLSMDTTAGSTLARTSWMSCGLASALSVGEELA